MFSKKIGIDLGTVNVLIAYNNQIVLQEPSMVALTTGEVELVRAIGQDARDMWGRHPEDIVVMRPLRDGVIADYEVTEAMLRYFMRKVNARTLFRRARSDDFRALWRNLRVVEKRAVHEAAVQAGARVAYLIPEPLAAAIGAGLPVTTPAGNMILNMGGGVAEAAVLALGNVVVAHSMRVGGQRLDEAIINYVRRKTSLIIGEPTAESVKIQIGAAVPQFEELSMEIQGRDQVSGLPRTITITTSEVVEAIQEPLSMIISVAKKVLSDTPPELASDIIDRGIVLTGGGALLRGIEQYVTNATGVPAYRSDEPLVATALGAVRAINNPSLMRGNVQQL